MKADPASQRRLRGLQDIDTAVARLEHRVQTLPVHRAIADLAAQRSQAADALTAAETRQSDAEAAQAKAEAAVGPARERLTRNQQRVDEGRLDAKALSSMVEEIEHLKGRISDLEDVELAAMEAFEEAEAEVAAAADRVQAVAADLQAKVAERD
ncbi:MAG: nucleic acid-binding protein, partial [Propionibacteriaceae bacterium]|nr:nucleic acid-binding protein [Propionibacteriaceae bacterium]